MLDATTPSVDHSSMYFLQLTAVADTVMVRQVPPVRTMFEQVVFVSSGLTSILTLLVVLAVLYVLFRLRDTSRELMGKLDELMVQLRPAAANAREASADVKEAAAAAKAMVMESRETVTMANERVRETVEELTDRVNELSAIISKVTRMATRVGAIAGTAIGGIKAGARMMGIGRKKSKTMPVRDADERPRLRRKR